MPPLQFVSLSPSCCYSSTSEFLSLIYIVVFFIALLSMAVTGKGAIVRLRALVSFLFADVGKTKTE